MTDIKALKQYINVNHINKAAVIGGGFIGVAPETGLAIGETGGILVNKNYQTTDPDIYAVGDAVESFTGSLVGLSG